MHTNLKEPKQVEKKPSNVKITLWRQYKEWEDKTDLKKKKEEKTRLWENNLFLHLWNLQFESI